VPEDRVMIFIDNSNLMYTNLTGKKIDIGKLQKVLSNGRKLIRTYWYDGLHDVELLEKLGCQDPQLSTFKIQKDQKESFIRDVLTKKLGVTPRLTPLKYKKASGKFEPYQKGVDVLMSSDMLWFALQNAYDIAVAVTGDRDFIQVVQRIKDTGKRVEIAHFSHIESKQGSGLLHYGDRYWKLDSLDIFMD